MTTAVVKNVSWLKIGHFFAYVGTWLKNNWLVLLLLAGLVYAIIFARGKSSDYDQLIKQFQDQLTRNRQDLDQLRQIQQQELQKQQEINQKYNETLQLIQQNYQQEMAALDAQKKNELQNIIANTHDDPNAMAQQINALFGLPIYPMPPTAP